MNFRRKPETRVVQAIRLQQDPHKKEDTWVRKGDWLVVDDGMILYYNDKKFSELYELDN